MIFSGQSERPPRRSFPLGTSLGIHIAAFTFFVHAPAIDLPRPAESEYQQAIEGHEEKIVWYKFPKRLPNVSPPKARADKRPLQAEKVATQAMVSRPQNAQKRDQMVWTPAPEIVPAPLLDSANLIAVKLPSPVPKAFTAPPDIVRPEPPQVAMPDAPPLTAAAQTAPDLKAPLPPKAFEPPKAPERAAKLPQLAGEAPAIESAALRMSELPSAKLPPKPFPQPPGRARKALTAPVAASGAPVLAANVTPGGAVPAGLEGKLPPRPFTTPPSGRKPGPAGDASTGPAPDLPPNSEDLNVAIVGLNPVEKLAAIPAASRPAAFSAGPVLNSNGAASREGGAALSVPDLYVRAPKERNELLAQVFAPPTSSRTLRAAMDRANAGKNSGMIPRPDAPMPPVSGTPVKVSEAPDARFNGRDVFMMAIQMPNLTSYSGSWLMWYSDHTAREAGLAPIASPVPHRKVDPKYIATAVEERVEGTVTLGCVIDLEGKVEGVEIVRGADPRLNQSAEEALAKWEFYPATRNGKPVMVDVLVQIPFRVEPKAPSKKR